MIAYFTKLAGLPVGVAYEFTADQLTSAGYSMTTRYSNKLVYIDDFKRLGALLAKKYGAPKHNETMWSNSLYKSSPEQHGLALAMGHLTLVRDWQTDRTEIRLGLVGGNSGIALAIRYERRLFRQHQDSLEEKKALDDL